MQIKLVGTGFVRALCLALVAVLAGCGGGGGGGGGNPSSSSVTGTVATGAPVVGAEVRLKDKTGVETPKASTTDKDGKYPAIDVAGLTAPFVLYAKGPDPKDSTKTIEYYSMMADKPSGNGVSNISQITHAMLKQAAGADPASVYGAPASYAGQLTAAQIKAAQDAMRRQMQSIADALNIKMPADFISEAFTPGAASGSQAPMDQLLDNVKWDSGSGKLVDAKGTPVFTPGATTQPPYTPPAGMADAQKAFQEIAKLVADYCTGITRFSGVKDRAEFDSRWDHCSNSDAATTPPYLQDGENAVQMRETDWNDYTRFTGGDTNVERCSFSVIGIAPDDPDWSPAIKSDLSASYPLLWVSLAASCTENGAPHSGVIPVQFIKVGGVWKGNGMQNAQVRIYATTTYDQQTGGAKATVVPADYKLCVDYASAGSTTYPATLGASAKCGNLGATSSIIDVTAWRPANGTAIFLRALFVEASSNRVLSWSAGQDRADGVETIRMGADGLLNRTSFPVCAGTSAGTCIPASGVK